MLDRSFTIFVIVACFSSVFTKNATLEMVNTCYFNNNDHAFIQPNSSTALRLSLLQYGLNCTIEFLSRSPLLQFHFDNVNLPYDTDTNECLDTVEIYDYDLKNGSRISVCREEDLPLNRTVISTSPAIVKVVNRCPRGKCNYAQKKFFFWITISEKFIEKPVETTPNQTIINTTACPAIINDVIVGDDVNNNDAMLETIVFILSGLIIFMVVLVAFLCWFGRTSLCNRVYRVKSIDSVHLKSKADLTSPDDDNKGVDGPCVENEGKKWAEIAV